MQGCGDEPKRGLGTQLAAGRPVGCCCRGTGAVAVDERGDEPAVDVAGEGDVIRARDVGGDRFLTVDVGLHMQSPVVALAAPEAVVQFIGVVLLNGFGLHGHPPGRRTHYPGLVGTHRLTVRRYCSYESPNLRRNEGSSTKTTNTWRTAQRAPAYASSAVESGTRPIPPQCRGPTCTSG